MLILSLKQLRDHELTNYHTLDDTPYGEALATAVAKKLTENPGEFRGLYHAHRDYCGLGLFFIGGDFILARLGIDGYGPDKTLVAFHERVDFITWLAQENDQHMALYGEYFNNQTITRQRLLWYLSPDYSSNWNAYCAFVHESNEK